jgi:hypothetical protein
MTHSFISLSPDPFCLSFLHFFLPSVPPGIDIYNPTQEHKELRKMVKQFAQNEVFFGLDGSLLLPHFLTAPPPVLLHLQGGSAGERVQ